MIVPMKKVSLIILGDQKEKTLKKLRRLGLVHIEITQGTGRKIEELQAQVALLESSLFAVSEQTKKCPDAKEATTAEALSVAERIAALGEEQTRALGEDAVLSAELERLKCWGSIDPAALAHLGAKGVELALYEMPLSEYKKLGAAVKTLMFHKTKTTVRTLVIKSGTEEEEELLRPLDSCKVELPRSSTQELKQQYAALKAHQAAIEEELLQCAAYAAAMRRAITALQKEIQFETYATGMAEERLSSENAEPLSISYFQGYIESENVELLKTAATENSWGLLVEEPTEEDHVPTKLKNNKFVSLIYPLTDFLGTVPGYFEYDISAWFLSFILIFFGIIFGDGGYGLFICAIAAIPILKGLIAKKPIAPAFLLIGLFGLSTVLWGTLTCTWFGLAPEYLPSWLKSLSIPVISNVYADKLWQPFWVTGEVGLTTSQNLQILCFSLALIQLSVAHVKCALRNRRSLKLLGDLGAILQLLGIYYVVLSLVVNGAVFGLGLVVAGIPIGTVAIALVGVGFVMSFVFSNYEGNVLKSLLASLKDIVSVLLGVINVFSDIVSYIRLWAVGLAGAAISATVNELVSPFLGNFLFILVALVLLVFGHGLNMILNVLSVIVHGIRLNTLEFSSHLNMSWSGHKYDPFRE